MKTAIVDYGMGNLHSVLKSVQAAQALSGKAAEILSDRPPRRHLRCRQNHFSPVRARCPTVWRRCGKAVWARQWKTD